MSNPFSQFNQFLLQYGYAQEDLEQLNQMCSIVTFQKGDVIFNAGEKHNQIYFICKGIIRSFVVTQKDEINTYNFRMENMIINAYSNYNYTDDLKALVNVGCLEDCIMVKIPLLAVKFMVDNFSMGDRVARYLAEAHVIELVHFIINRDTKSILDRYIDLENRFPNIHQRVSQHIIASYLGTTPVHLSRVKKSRLNS